MINVLDLVDDVESNNYYDTSIMSIIDILKDKESKRENIRYLRLKSIWSDIRINDNILLDDFLYFMHFVESQFFADFVQKYHNHEKILGYLRSRVLQSYYNWLVQTTKIQLCKALWLWCKKWLVYKLWEEEFVITNWKWDSWVGSLLEKLSFVKTDPSNQKAYLVNRRILLTDQWNSLLVDDEWNILIEWDSISQTFDDLFLVKSNYKKHIYNCDGQLVYWWLEYHEHYKIQDENYLTSYYEGEGKGFSLVNIHWENVFGWLFLKKIHKSFSNNWIDYISGLSSDYKFVIIDINGEKIYENDDHISHIVVQTNSPFVIWVRDSKGNVIFIKDKQICKLQLDLPFNCSIWTIKLMESIFVVYEQEWKKIDKIVSLEWNELFKRHYEENPWLTKFKLQYYFIIDGVGYLFCFEQKDNNEKTYVIMDSQWNIRFGSENSKEIHEIKRTISNFYIAEITKNKKKFLKSIPFTNHYDLNWGIVDINQLDLLVWVKKHKVVKECFHFDA